MLPADNKTNARFRQTKSQRVSSVARTSQTRTNENSKDHKNDWGHVTQNRHHLSAAPEGIQGAPLTGLISSTSIGKAHSNEAGAPSSTIRTRLVSWECFSALENDPKNIAQGIGAFLHTHGSVSLRRVSRKSLLLHTAMVISTD